MFDPEAEGKLEFKYQNCNRMAKMLCRICKLYFHRLFCFGEETNIALFWIYFPISSQTVIKLINPIHIDMSHGQAKHNVLHVELLIGLQFGFSRFSLARRATVRFLKRPLQHGVCKLLALYLKPGMGRFSRTHSTIYWIGYALNGLLFGSRCSIRTTKLSHRCEAFI